MTRLIRTPLCLVRGEWDSLCTDADALWLWHALTASPLKREVKLGKGTHLMHLQEERLLLYRETLTFLQRENTPAAEVC